MSVSTDELVLILPCGFAVAIRREAKRENCFAEKRGNRVVPNSRQLQKKLSGISTVLTSTLKILDRIFQPDTTVEQAIWQLDHPGVTADFNSARNNRCSEEV